MESLKDCLDSVNVSVFTFNHQLCLIGIDILKP